MASQEIPSALKALRRDGLVEFRKEVRGSSRVVAHAPSSELILRALKPHFPENADIENIGLGITIEINENASFAQPILPSAADRKSDPHLGIFVAKVDENGPCRYEDILEGDEIWSLDGTMVRDLEFHEIHNLLRGRAGSQAHLIIMRYAKEPNRIVVGGAVADRRELVKSHAVVVGRWPAGFVPIERCLSFLCFASQRLCCLSGHSQV
jgi:hypothetical protein